MRSNLTRSTLTALGVIIGIIAVTLMGTAVNGISLGFDKSMAVLGDDVLYVTQWPWPWTSHRSWAGLLSLPGIFVAGMMGSLFFFSIFFSMLSVVPSGPNRSNSPSLFDDSQFQKILFYAVLFIIVTVSPAALMLVPFEIE